jgi:hypothetical protein
MRAFVALALLSAVLTGIVVSNVAQAGMCTTICNPQGTFCTTIC